MRIARRVRGVSVKELASEAGVSMSSIYQAERGDMFPGVLLLSACADVLGISIDEYIGRKGTA